MRVQLVIFAAAAMTTSMAEAGSQSSNTSSNRSSNSGVVRERIVDTYCEDGFCQRYVRHRVYRDDWQSGHERERRRYRDPYYEDDDD
ncbi:hypothetical protein ACDY96_35770 [Rhizobium mongolense]|uniref:Uncharacterized protein n=1 Tax=Rhizobium gallicum TaxID=56730 RepID=A0A1L5NIW7_9HYPH|nr:MULTISPECIES: hypothetical protein [Rhizobium]APO67850.1 hypothetical protein IE4872_CH02235 [Rhizobium gallicum]QPB21561.1 hypothetical protein ISN39_09045 [Rhizobium sp. 007]ULJ73169.1 hypothetical protein L2W42_05995 [Rhizobium gallicum]WFU89266.1 hypothetical protein QA644_09590 [Rhizobium sp. CC1099]